MLKACSVYGPYCSKICRYKRYVQYDILNIYNGNGYTYGKFNCTSLITIPSVYNKAQVDNPLTGRQNTLICRDHTQLNPLVQGFPLLGGANIVPSISGVPPLTFTYKGNAYIEIGLAVDLSQKKKINQLPIPNQKSMDY